MQNPKISIIIPFYNVEKYIEECIESVVNQTIKDIEIIFVNDGSTDSSAAIVKKYADTDNRIKLINLEKRKGQGYARNRAIEIANGDYIGFVDSDDFVAIDMFEKLYSLASQNDNDITMCLAQEFDEETKKFIDSDYYSLALLKEFKDTVFSAKDTKDIILNINVALWNKLYKHSYLKEIKAKFPEGYIYEDLPFFFSTFLPANRIQIVWEHLYRYRINRKTSTMNQFNNKVLDRIPMVSLTYDKLKKVSFFKDIKKEVQAWIINDLFHRYTLLEEGYQKEFFFGMKKIFENLEIKNTKDKFWNKVYHFEGYNLVLKNNFETFNQKVFYEYIDIHNIENRIIASTAWKLEEEVRKTNERFFEIQNNINETYDYINKNRDSLRKEIQFEKGNAQKHANEKIKECNEQIAKSFEYTNVVRDDIKNQLEERAQEIEVKNIEQTDKKIKEMYDSLNKNYEYTEELVKNTKEETLEETNEKIAKVYEDIKSNYEYTEELAKSKKEETLIEINTKIDKIYDDIKANYEYTEGLAQTTKEEINEETGLKINQVYEDIKANYEYTERIVNELDEKFNIAQGECIDELISEKIKGYEISNTERTDEKVAKIYDDIKTNYEYTEKIVNELENRVNENFYNSINGIVSDKIQSFEAENSVKVEKIYDDIKTNYEYTEKVVNELEVRVNSKIDEDVKSKISEEIQHFEEKNTALTNKKLTKLSNDIKSNYKYSEQIVNNLANKIDEKLDEEINNAINNQNGKIEAVAQSILDEIAIELQDFATQNNEKSEQALCNLETKINTQVKELIEQRANQSEIISNERMDEKASKIYDDIKINYDYTEKIVADLEYKLNEKIDNTNFLFEEKSHQLENKINDLNISTAQTVNEFSDKFENLSGAVDGKIYQIKDEIIVDTDNKISQVYDGITQNYKYTEKIVQDLEDKVNEKESNLYNYTNEIKNSVENKLKDFEEENNEIHTAVLKTQKETVSDVAEIRKHAGFVGEFNISDEDIRYGLMYGRSVIAEYLC